MTKTYTADAPCKHGHAPVRYIANRRCVVCCVENAKKWQKANWGKVLASLSKYRNARLELSRARERDWYKRNTAKKNAQTARNRKENPALYAAIEKKSKSEHRGRRNAEDARRRAAEIQRTPKWLDSEDHWLIKEAYDLAALRTKVIGFAWHVDHVTPLQGRKVSGLHIPTNLRVIPWLDNLKKGNRA